MNREIDRQEFGQVDRQTETFLEQRYRQAGIRAGRQADWNLS